MAANVHTRRGFADALRDIGIEPPTKISAKTGKETFDFSARSLSNLANQYGDNSNLQRLLRERAAGKRTQTAKGAQAAKVGKSLQSGNVIGALIEEQRRAARVEKISDYIRGASMFVRDKSGQVIEISQDAWKAVNQNLPKGVVTNASEAAKKWGVKTADILKIGGKGASDLNNKVLGHAAQYMERALKQVNKLTDNIRSASQAGTITIDSQGNATQKRGFNRTRELSHLLGRLEKMAGTMGIPTKNLGKTYDQGKQTFNNAFKLLSETEKGKKLIDAYGKGKGYTTDTISKVYNNVKDYNYKNITTDAHSLLNKGLESEKVQKAKQFAGNTARAGAEKTRTAASGTVNSLRDLLGKGAARVADIGRKGTARVADTSLGRAIGGSQTAQATKEAVGKVGTAAGNTLGAIDEIIAEGVNKTTENLGESGTREKQKSRLKSFVDGIRSPFNRASKESKEPKPNQSKNKLGLFRRGLNLALAPPAYLSGLGTPLASGLGIYDAYQLSKTGRPTTRDQAEIASALSLVPGFTDLNPQNLTPLEQSIVAGSGTIRNLNPFELINLIPGVRDYGANDFETSERVVDEGTPEANVQAAERVAGRSLRDVPFNELPSGYGFIESEDGSYYQEVTPETTADIIRNQNVVPGLFTETARNRTLRNLRQQYGSVDAAVNSGAVDRDQALKLLNDEPLTSDRNKRVSLPRANSVAGALLNLRLLGNNLRGQKNQDSLSGIDSDVLSEIIKAQSNEKVARIEQQPNVLELNEAALGEEDRFFNDLYGADPNRRNRRRKEALAALNNPNAISYLRNEGARILGQDINRHLKRSVIGGLKQAINLVPDTFGGPDVFDLNVPETPDILNQLSYDDTSGYINIGGNRTVNINDLGPNVRDFFAGFNNRQRKNQGLRQVRR